MNRGWVQVVCWLTLACHGRESRIRCDVDVAGVGNEALIVALVRADERCICNPLMCSSAAGHYECTCRWYNVGPWRSPITSVQYFGNCAIAPRVDCE